MSKIREFWIAKDGSDCVGCDTEQEAKKLSYHAVNTAKLIQQLIEAQLKGEDR